MDLVALIDAVVEGRASFKEAGRQLEATNPDQHAAVRLITAYCDGRIEGWKTAYLLGCLGHAAGYDIVRSILLSDKGKSYAGVALVKMDKARAFADLSEIILSGQHPVVRRDAAYGLADYRSEEAIEVFLLAHEAGRILPINQLAYSIARCNPTDTTLLELLGSPVKSKQKLAFAVIDWLVSENMQSRRPGREIAALVRNLLQDPDIIINSQRREGLSTWADASLAAAT